MARCMWGLCKASYKLRKEDFMKNVEFIPFPKPWINLDRCNHWVHLCGLKQNVFTNVDITKNSYVCSSHFVGGKGPSLVNPDPFPATSTASQVTSYQKNARSRRTPKADPTPCYRAGVLKKEPFNPNQDLNVLDTLAEQSASTLAEQGPVTSAEHGPSTLAEQGPATSAEHGPATLAEQAPATSAEHGPSTLAEQGPATSAEHGLGQGPSPVLFVPSTDCHDCAETSKEKVSGNDLATHHISLKHQMITPPSFTIGAATSSTHYCHMQTNSQPVPNRIVTLVSKQTQTNNKKHVAKLFDTVLQDRQFRNIPCSIGMGSSLCYDNIKTDRKKFKYFTGLSLEHFHVLYRFLGPDVCANLKYWNSSLKGTPTKTKRNFKLSDYDMLTMTLVRLRRGFTETELGYFFEVSQSSVSCITYTWIQFMFLQFKELKKKMFVSRQHIKQDNLPACFKYFKNIRVIIDCAEFKSQKPGNFQKQGNTYSSYKATNTHKVLFGVVPRGSFSFISDCYEGSISDKELFLDCGLTDLLEPLDNIMADRGFDVQAEMHAKHVTVTIPPFLHGRAQLTPQEEMYGKRVSKARGHVERAIQRVKAYRILSKPVPSELADVISQIVYVVSCLVNFEYPLVN